MASIINKVLAYVTRGDRLLVFKHRDFPEAGLQVPAGTIEEGESPHDAVLREVTRKAACVRSESSGFLGVTFTTLPRIETRPTTATSTTLKQPVRWHHPGSTMKATPATVARPSPSPSSG